MKITKELQELINTENWDEISHSQVLSEKFIEKHKDEVDWNLISEYQALSEKFIEKHKDDVNWDCISKYQVLSEKFIEKHKDDVDWDCISCYQVLSEKFIEKHREEVDWNYISQYQVLSEKFIEKHRYDVDVDVQRRSHAKKSLAKKRDEMAKYAKMWKLKFDGKFLYAFREHDKFGRGAFNQTKRYLKGETYRDWHCDMDETVVNSFGLGIWPEGNTPVKVALKDWGCAVNHDGETLKKGRVFAFTVL